MVLSILLGIAAVPVWIAAAYLLLLTVFSGKPRPLPRVAPRLRFTILIPAHNEEAGVLRTVRSALAVHWPASLRRVLVIADNCTDATAERARQGGAEVLERQDPERRGKGYALDFGFTHLLGDGWTDVVMVADADSYVSPATLESLAACYEAGAQAVQPFNGVLNVHASWRTRLFTIALALFHRLRSRGRERLGLSCGLRGNGMSLSVATLRSVPHHAYSIVEDLEYGLRLGRAGIRVWYADEGEVLSDMEASERTARTQRLRWEGGRREIARAHAWPLLRDALRERSPLLLDLAMDLLVPPLGTVGSAAAGLALAGLLLGGLGWISLTVAIVVIAPLLLLCVHVLRGVVLSGLGWRGWVSLLRAPGYVIWKLSLRFGARAGRPSSWVRTERGPPRANPPADS